MICMTTKNGYIISVGVNIVGKEITEEEYNAILSRINSASTAPSGYTYKLRADNLEWELVELPSGPEPELTDEEVLSILLGGDSE